MKRIGMMVDIKPEKIDEYKKLHAKVWPKILQNLTELNCKNDLIYFHNNLLFVYMEFHGDNYERDMKFIIRKS